jgi:multiple sugar transport system permease protein
MSTTKNFTYWLRRGGVYLVLIVTSLIMILPFYWSVGSSFKLEQNVFASPPQWIPNPATLENYINVITKYTFPRYFLNSVFVSGTVTLLNVFFDTLAAYAFAKLRFPGRNAIFFLLLMGLMVPFQVNLIPMYKLVSILGWKDTYAALIIPAMTSITGIFLMRQFMNSIPDEILDSARIDGCSEFGVFSRVVFPLCLPGVATLVIITFMGIWNDFLWPRIVINSQELFTLPLGLTQLQTKYTSSQAQVMAGTVLVALPMILVFLIMQRQFIEGMTAGAVKG